MKNVAVICNFHRAYLCYSEKYHSTKAEADSCSAIQIKSSPSIQSEGSLHRVQLAVLVVMFGFTYMAKWKEARRYYQLTSVCVCQEN
jgi:hypothetical protein